MRPISKLQAFHFLQPMRWSAAAPRLLPDCGACARASAVIETISKVRVCDMLSRNGYGLAVQGKSGMSQRFWRKYAEEKAPRIQQGFSLGCPSLASTNLSSGYADTKIFCSRLNGRHGPVKLYSHQREALSSLRHSPQKLVVFFRPTLVVICSGRHLHCL